MKFRFVKKAAAISLMFAFACCFSVFSSAVDAPSVGSVTVDVIPEAEGIELRLHEVADIVNAEFKLNTDFAASNVDITDLKDSDAAQAAAEAMMSYAESKSLTNGIDMTVNADGKAIFSDLSVDKVYLIYQLKEAHISIQPMLVSVPYIDGVTANYDVKINAKFADNSDAFRSAVILNKVDDSSKPLKGAVFTFQSKEYYTDNLLVPNDADKGSDSKGNYYWKAYGSDLTTNAYGQIVVEKIPFGTYRFVEVKAPDGYILDSTPHEFELSVAGAVKAENGVYSKARGTIAELTIKNMPVPTSSTPEPSNPSTPTTPTPSGKPGNPVLTGDSLNVLPFLCVVIAAGLVITLTAKRTSKNKADR